MSTYRCSVTKKARYHKDETSEYLNWDSILHLEAHHLAKRSQNSRLLTKFSGKTQESLTFPTDLEADFPFIDKYNKDIALVHIDGNGMGLLVQELQTSLKSYMQNSSLEPKERDKVYREVLRLFSASLCEATKAAAQFATDKLYKRVKNQDDVMPMRPLVLGGDDVTLLVRSDLAIDYALYLCDSFKTNTKQQLKDIKERFAPVEQLDTSKLPDFLTASGGIVFQKSGQPFITANQFAEELCKYAKELTKETAGSKPVGPAALAYHKLSSVMAADVDSTMEQVMSCQFKQQQLYTGVSRFLVESSPAHTNSFEQMKTLLQSMRAPQSKYPITASKWRKLLGHLSQTEPDNLARTLALYEKHADNDYISRLKSEFSQFNSGTDADNAWWYWQHPQKDALQTIISDIIILDRYWVSTSKDKEPSKCN